jgi:hypothetical protein
MGDYPFSKPASSGGGGATVVVQPTGDTTGGGDAAAISAAVASLPATGGTISLTPGHYYLVPGVVVIAMTQNRPVRIQGNGAYISAVVGGSGAVIRQYGSYATSSAANNAGISDITIDGTSASAGIIGFEGGDCTFFKMDHLVVQNFTGAGSIGILLVNTITWTEEGDWRALVNNCANTVIIEAGAGYNSFGYNNFDFTIFAAAGQQGLQVLNGAYLYHGSLRIRGDFGSAAAPANAVLYLGGVNAAGGPANGDTVNMLGCTLAIQVEVAGAAAAGPITIQMDPTHFAYAAGNYGILHFGIPGGIPFTEAVFEVGQFNGNFLVNGDPTFGINDGYGVFTPLNNPVAFAAPTVQTPGQLPTPLGDLYAFTLTGNTTMNLAPSGFGGETQGEPQRITVKITQAAAGGFTVTWPKPGAPTTAAPAVYWPGGVAPTMTATANATDVYDLETLDGVHWYGVAHQAMS